MPKLQVEIPPDLHRSLKEEARESGMKFGPYVASLLIKQQPKTITLASVKYTEQDIQLTSALYNAVAENFDFLKDKKPTAKEYGVMHKLVSKYDAETVKYIIEWSTSDSFWRSNIRSVGGLAKKFETLMVQAKSSMAKNRVYSA